MGDVSDQKSAVVMCFRDVGVGEVCRLSREVGLDTSLAVSTDVLFAAGRGEEGLLSIENLLKLGADSFPYLEIGGTSLSFLISNGYAGQIAPLHPALD